MKPVRGISESVTDAVHALSRALHVASKDACANGNPYVVHRLVEIENNVLRLARQAERAINSY